MEITPSITSLATPSLKFATAYHSLSMNIMHQLPKESVTCIHKVNYFVGVITIHEIHHRFIVCNYAGAVDLSPIYLRILQSLIEIPIVVSEL